MPKKTLNLIFLLSVAGVLILVGALGASRARRIRSDTPIVIEEAVIDVIDINAVEVTPAPTATPTLPEFAVTLLSNRRPVMTLYSEPEAQRVLWEYLQKSAVAPENETFVSAKFDTELIIGEPEASAEALDAQQAAELLNRVPELVPVRVQALRKSVAESAVEKTESTDKALAAGSRIIVQLGAGAVTETRTSVAYVAGKEAQVEAPQTNVLREARATIIQNGAFTRRDTDGEPEKNEGERGKSADGLKLEWPMRGSVSSHFGFRNGKLHAGVDIENSAGTQVNAPGEGVVVYCGKRGAYGTVVDIDHGYGFLSRLTHLENVQVEYNQRVFLGDAVGTLADNSTEEKKPHLHYELIIGNVPYNPAFYVS